jgi:hypothetical protein
MTATNEEPEWKVAALGKVRATPTLPTALWGMEGNDGAIPWWR